MSRPSTSLVLCPGPRALMSRLLDDVAAHLSTSAARLAAFSAPIRVVVNSRALRLHVSAALVGRFDALAGVEVLTMHSLARQILARAGATAPPGAPLLGVLVRREAAALGPLRGALDHLDDGYYAVSEAVRDLLDAGFIDLGAADDCLAALPASAALDRGRAILAVAAACRARLAEHGLGHAGAQLGLAADLLRRDPDGLLPGGAVLIAGFDDAPGLTLDLLETLVRYRGAVAYVAQPPDPADLGRTDLGVAFTRRLRERLAVGAVDSGSATAPAPELSAFRAPGPQAEAREVAVRVRGLLDQGVVPETIAVVARDLGPYVVPLRRELRRLGVPFSGIGAAGPPDPVRRRVAALAELLAAGPDISTDRWLDAVGSRALRAPDLRLGLRCLGCARLGDLSGLDLERVLSTGGSLPLPLRAGLGAGEGGEARARRRTLSGATLAAAVALAGRVASRWSGLDAERSWREHLADIRKLVGDLDWRHDDGATAAVRAALDGLSAEIPADFMLTRDEVVLLACRALDEAGGDAVGGRGGGVAVLGVMEARGRTPQHLFLVGLSRDGFPRSVSEDALLPDALRRPLRQVLPDLPVKAEGHDEERFLFAQLLASAPLVTLSWPFVDDDGKQKPPSPLVARLRLADVGTAPHLDTLTTGIRPASEHARLAGLMGSRAEHRDRMAVALAARRLAGGRPAGTVADARAAILSELDLDLSTTDGRRRMSSLGPYLGMVGPAALDADTRLGPLWVTTIEAVAACGWQAFLTRCLRVEASPDPLGGLPAVDRQLVGTVAHAALERIVADAGTPTGIVDLDGAEIVVPWPDEAALSALLAEVSEQVVRESGVPYVGFSKVVAVLARPYLDAARAADWLSGPVRVLGAEVQGASALPLDGGSTEVRFKADRVDRVDGALLLTDYKTGRPVSTKKTPGKARDDLIAQVRAGSRLQAAVYASATAAGTLGARGRYLFISPSTEPHARLSEVERGDSEVIDALHHAVSVAVSAWRTGALVPRLEDAATGAEPKRCEWCEVSTACLRGDSGSRGRLHRWAAAAGEGEADRAALQLWTIALAPDQGAP